MKAKSMIEEIGVLAGLQHDTRGKIAAGALGGAHVNESSDGSAQSIARGVVEEHGDVRGDTRALNEGFIARVMDGFGSDGTMEDRIREGVNMIKYAIIDEALKGLGDDGRTMKDLPHGSPWPIDRIDKMLSKEVFVDRFRPLLQEARAIVDEFLE